MASRPRSSAFVRVRIGLRVWELGQSVHEPLRMRELALPATTSAKTVNGFGNELSGLV